MEKSNALGAEARLENKTWMLQQVNPIFEPLMLKMVKDKPENAIQYMLAYMEENFGKRALNGDLQQADILKAKIIEMEEKLARQQAKGDSTADSQKELNSEDETDEDDEEDYMDDLPEKLVNKHRGPRASVSAEAFGTWNQKGAFQPKVIAKTQEQKTAISQKLNLSFMFSALDDKEKGVVIDAMVEYQVKVNEVVIKEGDQGDCLYVVDSGNLMCTKVFPGSDEPTFLTRYQSGDAFGELALLYNAPRAATITANDDCLLWKLDRETFNHIVKDAASRKREKYEKFLDTVSVFSTMEPYERAKLADAFKEVKINAGEYIIRENEDGNDLYLLQEGKAHATKTIEADKPPQKVMDYKMGDVFGERALIKNEPRAANIIADTDCLLVSMDRHSVKRLLGPLEDLLMRNFDLYEKFTSKA